MYSKYYISKLPFIHNYYHKLIRESKRLLNLEHQFKLTEPYTSKTTDMRKFD